MIKVGYNAIELGTSSGGGGSTTFDGLTDKATVDLPVVNTPLANALSAKEDTTNKKTAVDANKTSDTFFPTVKAVFDWVSGLFVKGAVSSTDNAIARFDGATGKALKNSVVTINDAGVISVNGAATVQPMLINGVPTTLNLGSTNTTNTGAGNQSYGTAAGASRTTGTYAIAQGTNAGRVNTTGSYWVAQGTGAGPSNTTGSYWVAQGANTGYLNTTGGKWVAQGYAAGYSNTTGSYWVAQGYAAGFSNTTGSNWVAQGYDAGRYTSTGNLTVANNTIHIGFNSKSLADSATNEIVIGANAVGNGNNTVTLGDSSITGTYLRNPRIIGTLVDSTGSAGTDGQVLKKVGGLVVWSNP